jgi:hypothetical protein
MAELQHRSSRLPASFIVYAAEQLEAMRNSVRGGQELEVQRIFALLTLIRGAMPASEIATILSVQLNLILLDTRVTRWFTIRLGEKEASVAFLHPRLAEVFRDALARNPETQGLVYQVEQDLIRHCTA